MKIKKMKYQLLSLMLLLTALTTLFMLQSFNTSGPIKGYVRIETIGVNNSACILRADNLTRNYTAFWHVSGSQRGNGIYGIDTLISKDEYSVSLCFQNEGGSIPVTVQDGKTDDKGVTDTLDPAVGACQ